MQRTPASSGGVFLYADTPHLCGSVSIQKNIAVTAVRCIESPKRSPTEAPPPAEHSYSAADTPHLCGGVCIQKNITVAAVRCIEFAPAKIKDFARGPRLLSTPLFRRLQNFFRPNGSSAPAEHYYSNAFFLMALQHTLQCHKKTASADAVFFGRSGEI